MTTVEQNRTTHTEAATIMPFGGWETTPIIGGIGDDEALFRFPAADDPAPATSRLLGMSLYAAGLGIAGVGVGARGLFIALGGTAFWFMPILALLSLVSVGAAVGAFLSIHRRVLPWLLLLGAGIPMAGAVLLAALY